MPPRNPNAAQPGARGHEPYPAYGEGSQAHISQPANDDGYYDYASHPPASSPPPPPSHAFGGYPHTDSTEFASPSYPGFPHSSSEPPYAPPTPPRPSLHNAAQSSLSHSQTHSPYVPPPAPVQHSHSAPYFPPSSSYHDPFAQNVHAPFQGTYDSPGLSPGQYASGTSLAMSHAHGTSAAGHQGYEGSYAHDPFIGHDSQDVQYEATPGHPAAYHSTAVPGYTDHEEQHELDGDVPLLPPNGNYAYAPASSFDAHGNHMGAMDGDEEGMYDDEAMKQEDDENFLPGGYDPSMVEQGNGGNVRYGRIPQRVPRRYKTLKRVELFHGNLVLDCPTAPALLEKLNDRESREMTHARYSAVTCDPDDFLEERYTLRQVLFDPPRRTELMICLTMYNEDEKLFCRTLHGVLTNIAFLCSRSRSRTWGADAWKRVVVVIVADGRMKCNPRVLSVLAALGVYQEGVAKNVVNGKNVTMHLYEYTTQLSVDPSLKFRGREKGVMPTQIIFALKENNAKKINSHRWAFNAFGRVLQPNVCVLLDVGTMPRSKAIYHLWKAFDINSNVAGACGEIVALKGKLWSALLNPLVAAQNFEYKMSNILDKPLESVFGYITVLPGAFSAYRYIALQNDAKGNGPLASYFKGEKLHNSENNSAGMYEANMYLAEDRILCWELTSKRDAAWILHYVKSAQAVTDVPDTVPELISQRRRWLNGSFFAGLHSIVKFGYIYRSSHSFGRKLALHVEMLYQVVTLTFTWFGIANYFLAFRILTTALDQIVKQLKIPNLILEYIYLALIVFVFLLSMGNRPAGAKAGYTLAMCLFGVLTVYMTFCAVFLSVKNIKTAEGQGGTEALLSNYTFVSVVISVAATYGVYLLASIIFLEPWHMFTSVIQYFLLAPSFVSVFGIYSMCNVHDVSWGTKGSDKVQTDLGVVGGKDGQVEITLPTEPKDIDEAYHDAVHVLATKAPKKETRVDADQKQQDYYATIRTNVVLCWVLTNAALAIAILSIKNTKVQIIYMAIILYTVAVLSAFRFCGALVYLVKRLFAGE